MAKLIVEHYYRCDKSLPRVLCAVAHGKDRTVYDLNLEPGKKVVVANPRRLEMVITSITNRYKHETIDIKHFDLTQFTDDLNHIKILVADLQNFSKSDEIDCGSSASVISAKLGNHNVTHKTYFV